MVEVPREYGAQKANNRPLWQMTALFVLIVATLQWGWGEARGTAVERAVIHTATVGMAVASINAMTPAVRAQAAGSRIKSPRGSINVLNGCEGTEVLFLLFAALFAYPLTWPARMIGLLGGTLLIFVANQIRLVVLFYSLQSDRALFDPLHGLVMPLILIALTIGLFVGLMNWDARERGGHNGFESP